MSIVQSGFDLGSASLAPEYAKKANSESNISLADSVDRNVVPEKTNTANVAVESESEGESKALTPEQLEKVAQQLQDFVGNMNRGLEFSVDKDSGRDVIKVIDKSSGDLVKQFPSEEVLTLVAKLSDMVGGFIDAKV